MGAVAVPPECAEGQVFGRLEFGIVTPELVCLSVLVVCLLFGVVLG